jgi:hypothetical protein
MWAIASDVQAILLHVMRLWKLKKFPGHHLIQCAGGGIGRVADGVRFRGRTRKSQIAEKNRDKTGETA